MGIRVVPNETVPPAIYRVLLPHERRVITVRRHLAVLLLPSLVVLGGLAGAGFVTSDSVSADALAITWAVWGFAFLYWLLRMVGWTNSYFAVTSQRLILVKGYLGSDIEMLPLSMASQVSFQRSILGRFLGYGRFVFEAVGSGRDFRTVNYLPYPEQLYIEVCGLLFNDPGTSDEDY